MLIKHRKASDVLGSEITPKSVFDDRRRFLKTAALAGAGLAASALPSLPAYAARTKLDGVVKSKWSAESLPEDDPINSYEDATSYNNFYEFGTAKGDPKDNAQDFKTSPWEIMVEGACAKPGKISFEDLIKPATLEERIYRFRCVEAWSMVIPWVGISLGDVLKRFEPTSDARYVYFETLLDPEQMPGQRAPVLNWPYKEGLRIDEAMHPLSILAVGMYGEVIPNQNGAPVRLMVPWKYGFKSIKSIVKIKFQKAMPPTSWNEAAAREYGFYSNVNPMVSHPRWSQASERRIGELFKRKTLMFNGYEEEVASLYEGMDLRKWY
ncbi:MAG: protein-methionine-sulfoxide reductase catalytic subunit MsrP [Rhodospirillales bacterium]|nr:protein-methionine-sulfoxide reductase catalytic subunit MsrP [Rhodospirillales bacterium]